MKINNTRLIFIGFLLMAILSWMPASQWKTPVATPHLIGLVLTVIGIYLVTVKPEE